MERKAFYWSGIYLIAAVVLICGIQYLSHPSQKSKPIDQHHKATAILQQMSDQVTKETQYSLEYDFCTYEKQKDCAKLYSAISAMNIVQERINILTFGYFRNIKKKYFQSTDLALIRQAGQCGNHTILFDSLLQLQHIKTRAIQFYNIDLQQHPNHITSEVYFNHKWNYFDISWGTFFLNQHHHQSELLSIKEILATKNPEQYAVRNNSELAYILMGQKAPDYLTSKTVDIVINGTGNITLYPTHDLNDQAKNLVSYFPNNVPNYFGNYLFQLAPSLPSYPASITYVLKDLPASNHLVMNVTFNTCSAGSKVNFQVKPKDSKQKAVETTLDADKFKIGSIILSSKKLNLVSGSTLYLSTTTPPQQETCYINIDNISLEGVSQKIAIS